MLMRWAPSEARSKTEAVDLFFAFGINQKYFLGQFFLFIFYFFKSQAHKQFSFYLETEV